MNKKTKTIIASTILASFVFFLMLLSSFATPSQAARDCCHHECKMSDPARCAGNIVEKCGNCDVDHYLDMCPDVDCSLSGQTCVRGACQNAAACSDVDRDGYGNPASAACAFPALDCLDSDINSHPGAAENCDGRDNNCAGGTDEGCDADRDGYCSNAKLIYNNTSMCPSTVFSTNGMRGNDCDDARAPIHPGAAETCGNGVDEDCSGTDASCPSTDSVNPAVAAFNVAAGTVAGTAAISWTVTDNSGLRQVELWRTTDNSGTPNASGWIQVPGKTQAVTGLSASGTFSDTPGSGIWWYGIHAVDLAGNIGRESLPRTIPLIPTSCVPNGCNGNCPANCAAAQDPDCGSTDCCGNGYCGGGENNASCPADCPAMANSVSVIYPANDGDSFNIGDTITVKLSISGPVASNPFLRLTTLNSASNFTTFSTLYDDGSHGDGAANDGVWGNSLSLQAAGNTVFSLSIGTDNYSNLRTVNVANNATCIDIVNNGNSADKLDIVYLGDDYDGASLGQFATDVNNFYNSLKTVAPFSTNWAKINVHRIDSTVDLGCNYNCQGIARLICCSYAVTTSLASVCPFDEIIVLKNNNTYGGSGLQGGHLSVSYRVNPKVAIHELGHAFGSLEDEYVGYTTNGPIGTFSDDPNCDDAAGCNKWSSIPGTVCLSGCNYPNWYRSINNGLMRSVNSTEGFGQVNINVFNTLFNFYN